MSAELCPCGQPLHYSTPWIQEYVEATIREHGYTITVTVGDLSVEVPRHWIALHGLKALELPDLVERFGWKRHLPAGWH